MRFTRDQDWRHLTPKPLIAAASLVQVISNPRLPASYAKALIVLA